MTDYTFGASSSVLFSTASIFFAGTIGGRDILFLFGDADQSHEAAIKLTGSGARVQSSTVKFTSGKAGTTLVSVVAGTKGLVTVWDSDKQLVLFADPVTAASFWAPAIPAKTMSTVKGLETFFQFGTNETVLVGGPNLVRNASISGSTLALRGDLNQSVMLTVIAPSTVRKVTWNGATVDTMKSATNGAGALGFLTASLTKKTSLQSVKLPSLTGWRFKDSLPEIQNASSDANWIVADHTTTNITEKPLFGDGRILFGRCFL